MAATPFKGRSREAAVRAAFVDASPGSANGHSGIPRKSFQKNTLRPQHCDGADARTRREHQDSAIRKTREPLILSRPDRRNTGAFSSKILDRSLVLIQDKVPRAGFLSHPTPTLPFRPKQP